MISVHVSADPNLETPRNPIAQEILTTVLHSEGQKEADVTLVFGDDTLLNRLKRTFFHLDQLTDVIAFRLNAEGERNLEGEIYISLPRASENAREFHEPFSREVARLIIHGGLHLMGYTDETGEEKERMRSKEEFYLDKLPWKDLF